MTEPLFTTLAILWTFSCLFAFVIAWLMPHDCRFRACPHRTHQPERRSHK